MDEQLGIINLLNDNDIFINNYLSKSNCVFVNTTKSSTISTTLKGCLNKFDDEEINFILFHTGDCKLYQKIVIFSEISKEKYINLFQLSKVWSIKTKNPEEYQKKSCVFLSILLFKKNHHLNELNSPFVQSNNFSLEWEKRVYFDMKNKSIRKNKWLTSYYLKNSKKLISQTKDLITLKKNKKKIK
ncbi:hypothetical protein A3Q56_02577 [Intoshia linei]|uniref:Uncharacterized protein n=1 Tax=Intoshia linei TaxID=1819745 RepID=A0A177B605_9BILA|nr:hypothetical protein A3Q56_02577 [Intoshia linei]